MRWNIQAVQTLRLYYPTMGAPFCAAKLGRTLPAIWNAAERYGVRGTRDGEAAAKRAAQAKRWRTTDAQDQAQFEANVMPIPETGCWIWTGSYTRGGLPRFQLHQKHWIARIWALARYRRIFLDKRQQTAPSCGLRECVSPWHAVRNSRGGNNAF